MTISSRTAMMLVGLLAVIGAGVGIVVELSSGPDAAVTPRGEAPPSPTAARTSTPPIPTSPAPTSPASAPGRSVGSGRSPFTGRSVAAGRPVLAVKIDNVRPARPQTGIGDADVVYVEPVEGGLSRIMAIFSASLPRQVGPVRSARESDLELLRQYGRPGLAYSGANRSVLATVHAAPVVDLSPARKASAYHRSGSRPAPHNLFVDPRILLRRSPKLGVAQDIGFRFGALPAGLGAPAIRKTVRYGAASTSFTWSAQRHRWQVTLDGRPATTTDGGRLGASTVVVQYTKITSSHLHDVLGNPTPYTHTVGSGRALVLRDGTAIQARWSRPSATAGTTFTTVSGAGLSFATGQVWVVYARSSTSG